MDQEGREKRDEEAPAPLEWRQPAAHPTGAAPWLCPICGGPGVERKQKWFCSRCGQLLVTCCD
jgi:hypothetical protein